MSELNHEHRLEDLPCHDPFILPIEGGYLLYTAFEEGRWERQIPSGADYPNPGGAGVLAWWSPDLVTWGSPSVVFTVPEGSWADSERSPWAPEVHAVGDRFVLSTTLHAPGSPLDSVRQRGTLITLESENWASGFAPSLRGSVLAVSDDPRGPFTLLDPEQSHTPPEFMALDGTLYRDVDGQLWLVYAHEWVQILDGTMEAVPLTDDLAVAGPPRHLFRASEASWFAQVTPSVQALAPYVTDGPQLVPLPGGALGMLWASYRPGEAVATGEYVETQAISPSGSLLGPWVQGEVLVDGNAGHGMVFRSHDGADVLVLHRGMNSPRVRAELHDVEIGSDGVTVLRRRS